MTLSLESLQVLDAIARRGSFAGAADELDRAPSAISYAIQRLEEETGVLLFDRSGRKAQLTAAGELVLSRGRDLISAAESLGVQARALETGWETEITVALDAVYSPECLWPLVRRFDREAPATTLRIITEVLGGSVEALLEGRASISVAAFTDRLPPGIRTREVGKVRFVYVASPSHPAAGAEPLDNDALASHRAIAVADTSRHQPSRTARLAHLQPVLTVSTFEAKISALEAGLGIGTLPEHLAEQVVDGKRLARLNVPPSPWQAVHMAWRVDRAGKGLSWLTRHLPEYLKDAPGKP